jgi:hypothetical protein
MEITTTDFAGKATVNFPSDSFAPLNAAGAPPVSMVIPVERFDLLMPARQA